jgi:NADPH2:quinone reductase
MKAVRCVEHGLPERLIVDDIALPELGKGQVRLKVHAAGVNFPDSLIIQNLYQFKPPLPFTPGSEAAGVIDAVGEGVTAFKPGDRALVMTGNGAFAEYVTANVAQTIPIADGMPFDIAAGFTMTYGTSHHALKQRARLQPGETVLVLGAAGGVGLTAVELAKLMGAKVIAAASSDEKLALCREYGADETINYTTADLKDAVKALTDGKGVDVVYDPVGDRYAEPAFRGIAWNGRYLVVGFAGGQIPSLPLNLPLIKGASIVGVFWGAFTQHEPAMHQSNMRELLDWYAAGKLRPHVSRKFPLAEGPAAIRWVMDRKATGKVVLEVG